MLKFVENWEATKYQHKLFFVRNAKVCACNNCDGLIDYFKVSAVS